MIEHGVRVYPAISASIRVAGMGYDQSMAPARVVLNFQSDVAIELVAPTDRTQSPPEPLDNTNDGATASFRVFDPAVAEVFSAAEASGQTEWSVTNAGKFKVGDVVEAVQNDGSVVAGTLTGVDVSAGTITSDTSLSVAAAAGNRVRKRLGAPITMIEFGTPALGTTDWGFRGILPDDHAGLVDGLDVDVEIDFDGGGPGPDLLRRICAVVRLVEDCP